MSIRKNLSFGLETRKVPKDAIARQIKRVAEILQIEDLLDRKPSQLSGGQRQRVAMGRAIARDPKVFLFDEPLSNLDAKLRVEMRAEIKKLHQRLGTTIVYVTHDQIEAMTLADRIAIMKDGIVQRFDRADRAYSNPNNLFVAGFIGSPSMNFIPVTLKERDGRLVAPLQNSSGGQFDVPLPQSKGNQADRQVIFGIRPENITDFNEGLGQREQIFSIQAEVKVTEPTGPDTLVHIDLNQTEILCRSCPEFAARQGTEMTLALDTSKILLFDPQSEQRVDR
jgi:multiple sugar transport system ATP-binding protein